MMKYLTCILMLLMMKTADAAQCRINGGEWFRISSNHQSIYVNVHSTPGGGVILLNGYVMKCRFEKEQGPSWAEDYWSTISDTLKPGPKFSDYKMGLRINGSDYMAPLPIIRIATMPYSAEEGVDLNTYLFVRTVGEPGKPINIEFGDVLATLKLSQTDNHSGSGSDLSFDILAGNNLIFEPSTCTINNNKDITIDFDQVDPTTIGDSPLSSPIQKTVTLNYSCPDDGITMPITIELKGSTSSFDSNALRMTNNDLGTAMIRNGVVVKPGSSFETQLTNSVGSDNVTFSLIRKPGSYPAAGVSTGSGTLIMGLP